MKPPRFTLRFLLVVVTIAAVGLGVRQRMYVERSITAREARDVEVGMSALEVRWRLGAPHRVYDSSGHHPWGFAFADSEKLPLQHFSVVIKNGRVESARVAIHWKDIPVYRYPGSR
jgi:hypothetical protein